MTATVDLVVRDGVVVDGSGGEPFEADIAVAGGRIVEIGKGLAVRGREEIAAKGQIVTPGFVDVHTHYDAQTTWGNRLQPSSLHGITTVVMGNCGVGFAPCRPEEHDLLIRLMEGVEDIPNVVLAEGVPWRWQSFPEYFDFLSGRAYDIDFAGYVPHAALRVYVMGDRACNLEPATPDDLRQMCDLLRDAMKAGALGFGTSRTIIHRSSDGHSIPTLTATEDELTALATVAHENGGIMQLVTDWDDTDRRLAQLGRIIERSGCPVTFSMTQNHRLPNAWRHILGWVGEANRAGKAISVQVLPRPLGLVLSHELTLNPFYSTPTYRSLADLSFHDKIRALSRPDIRERILNEDSDQDPTNKLGLRVRAFDRLFELADPPDYEPPLEDSIAARAARRGMRPEELAYDLLLEQGGRKMLYQAISNYADCSLDPTFAMLSDRNTIPGLGDGGAHLGSICDGSYSTFMLTHWARDRSRGERLSLPAVVKALSRDTAATIGLNDRGRIAPGLRADLNVIDFDRLTLRAPTIVRDLPAGGRRLMQRAEGYDATIVNGTVTYRQGEPTGALPGRLRRRTSQ